MSTSKPTSPEQRLKELLAIPERDRTDEEWDEMNGLYLSLSPENRINGPDNHERQNPRRNPSNSNRRSGSPSKPGGQRRRDHAGRPKGQ